jgi:hypothetical protein
LGKILLRKILSAKVVFGQKKAKNGQKRHLLTDFDSRS